MYSKIALIQITVFLFFFTLERLYPAFKHPVPPRFSGWWISLGLFALVWLRGLLYIWADIPASLFEFDLPIVAEGFIFYIVYSLGNYWVHRIKHSNRFLWHFVHKFHHSTSQMETRVAFYRHPTEIFVNTVYIIILGKMVLGVSPEALVIALAIEGSLESFHHANIHIPRKLYWVGHVFQLPGMHLVHHQYGLHRFNYAPFLWDWVFNTLEIPEHWDKRLGFSNSEKIGAFFLFR